MTPAETDAAIRAYTDPINAQLAGINGQLAGVSNQLASINAQLAGLAGTVDGNRASVDALAATGTTYAMANADAIRGIYATGMDDEPLVWDGPRRAWTDGATDWNAGRYWARTG